MTAALTVAAVFSEDARIDPERFFAAERSGCIVDERAPLAETPVSEGEAQAAVERATDAEELGYVPGQIVVVYEEDATSSDRHEVTQSRRKGSRVINLKKSKKVLRGRKRE